MEKREQLDLSAIADRNELLALLLEEEGFSVERNTPISPRGELEHLPLSFAQLRLWFLNQLVPNNPFYNVPGIIHLRGRLDIAVLERGLNEIVRRHEVLRTSFPEYAGQPRQLIASHLALALPIIDLREIGSPQEQDAVAQRLIRQEARRPFHLNTGPLIRVTLLLLAREEYLLLLDMHHIICDGWSMGVFFRELAALYEAFRADRSSPLAALPIQYADYALWQRERVENDLQEEQLGYWLRQLRDLPALLELPTDFPRPALQSFRGAMHTFHLPTELLAKCRELERQTGTTLFMVLLAAFTVLLYRYTGQSDLAVGSPIANRTRPEIENLIGFFVNTLVLRTNVTGNPTFLEVLERVKTVALEAYAHQDLPFERLVEALQPERSLSHTPLVQILFAVQNVQMEPQQIPGLALDLLSFDEGIAPFDLALFFKERGDEVVVDLVYSTDLFAPATIRRLEGHLLLLLDGAVSAPRRRIADLPLLTESERRQLLNWNRPTLAYPRDLCPQALFAAQAARAPDAVALAFQDTFLTYEELDRHTNRLAHHLRSLGAGPEVLVGLCIERSLEMIIGVLGILKAGAAYVPLDPEYPRDRLAFILADTRTPILLTHTRLRDRFSAPDASVLCLDTMWNALAQERADAPQVDVHARNLGYVIYTSGSTGRPKGVEMCLHTFTNLVLWQQSCSPGALRSLQFAPLSFDISFEEIFVTLCSGATLVVPDQAQRRDSERLLALLQEESIERFFAPFVALQALAEVLEQTDALPGHLREILTAGEQLRLTQPVRHLLSRLPGCRLYNNYGPSESHVCTAYAIPESGETCANLPPIGQPIANGAIYLLDEQFQPVPVGVAGELYIGGELLLARGYHCRPDLTAEKFLPDPFGRQPGGRLYRTGDRARYLPDGMIEFIGRIDFQVKVRGYRVEPGEIEVVLGQHPAVREVVVAVREEATGGKQLIAYLLADADQAPRSHEFRRYLLEHLPEYMVPSAFVLLNAWPLTPSGKIDRRALPSPGTEHWLGSETTLVPPRDPIEEALADIWMQVLGREPGGVYQNFFASGGHSLLATQVMSRMRKTFQVELPLRALFEAPTIAQLAERIREAITDERSAPTPQPRARVRHDYAPMSFAQQRMWFLNQFLPDDPSYNVAGGLRLDGELDAAALERSLNEIIRRHEALRTRFEMRQNVPVQVILPALVIPLPLIDLQHLAGTEREVLQQHIARDEANRLFDLRRGPLLHVVLLRLSAQEHVLLLCLHHIICDGWSLSVLFRELAALYAAFRARRPSPLAALPIQYADYALWQREWLKGETLEAQLAYWKRALTGLAALELPADAPRSLVQSWRGAVHEVLLPPALSRDLKALSQREGATLFMTLLAAFQILLWRYSGQQDIAVGTPIANRNRAESEGLIGCFVNTLVLRGDLTGNPRFREFLQQVRERCLSAYAHQDLPFEKIVDELQPDRDLSHSPLFQVMFALHNLPPHGEVLPGLRVSLLDIEVETVKFDLNLSLWDMGRGVEGHVRYRADLFNAATIERMMRHWLRLLDGIASHPERRLAELPFLTVEEERQLLHTWNASRGGTVSLDTLPRRFEEQASSRPDAVALVSETGALTYDELNRRANQLAGYLRKRGVGPEKMVGLWLEQSPELLIAVMGVLKAGGAYVPLDPDVPVERLHFLLRDASITVLLTQPRLREKLAVEMPVLSLEEIWEQLQREPSAELCVDLSPEAAAYVLYTSGSTGQPKGVVVAHRQVCNYVQAIILRVGPRTGQSYALLQPLTVDSSLTMLWGALLTGGRLLLIRRERGLDAQELATAFAEEPVDYLKIAPSHLAALLAGANPDQLLPREALIIGGESSHWRWARHVAASMAAGTAYNHYGPTEATVGVLMYQIEATGCAEDEPGGITPVGRPLEKNQVYVLDRWMRPVPVGAFGELYIGGEQVARGYLGKPALTAACFVPDPYSGEAGARLYRTGDTVRYRADGVLEFVGRRDEQVKIRGYRVEPGEIEGILSLHPQVREALVVVRETAAREKHLVAYLLTQEEHASLSQEVVQFARQRLPEYMLPTAVVTLKQWPRTSHGKIDRQALPVPTLTPTPTGDGDGSPRTPIEALLARIWAELLGFEQVGIYDNFFDLGGDSILTIKVVARTRQEGLPLTPRHLFQAQTIASLATLIGQQAGPRILGPGVESGPIAATPIQRWFFEKCLPRPQHWNQPVQLWLAEEVDEALLEAAVQQVFRHHPILRAVCAQGTRGWQLSLSTDMGALPWTRIDLSLLAGPQQDRALEEQATRIQASLDLARGPLGHVALFDLGKERGRRLLWVIHHLLVDAVSQEILLEDLQQAYQALQRGQPLRLPLPTTSFARWSGLLSEYARSPRLQAERAYWLDARWEHAPAVPVDFPAGKQHNIEGAARTLRVSITPEETRLLLQEVPRVYRTQINDALLAALALSFARWTGEQRLLLQLEGHGREDLFEDVDLSRSVGWFTTRFPVLLALNAAGGDSELPGPGEALVAVKEQLRQVPNHGIGYGVFRYLSEDQEVVERLRAFPDPEISFNYFGRREALADENAWLALEEHPAGAARDPQGRRSFVLEINALVQSDRLILEWTYSEHLHRRSTIEQVASLYIEALRAIIAHCQEPEAGSSTPSDFSLAALDEQKLSELEQLLQRHNVSGGKMAWG